MNEEPGKRKRRLRKMTWLLIIFNVLMPIWIVAVASAAPESCEGKAASCTDDAVSAGLGVVFLFGVWFVVGLVLLIIWFATRTVKVIVVHEQAPPPPTG